MPGAPVVGPRATPQAPPWNVISAAPPAPTFALLPLLALVLVLVLVPIAPPLPVAPLLLLVPPPVPPLLPLALDVVASTKHPPAMQIPLRQGA